MHQHITIHLFRIPQRKISVGQQTWLGAVFSITLFTDRMKSSSVVNTCGADLAMRFYPYFYFNICRISFNSTSCTPKNIAKISLCPSNVSVSARTHMCATSRVVLLSRFAQSTFLGCLYLYKCIILSNSYVQSAFLMFAAAMLVECMRGLEMPFWQCDSYTLGWLHGELYSDLEKCICWYIFFSGCLESY